MSLFKSDFQLIKTYKEELWFDVVPMNTCHVLLDRRRQYYRLIHMSYMMVIEVLVFTRYGRKITLF